MSLWRCIATPRHWRRRRRRNSELRIAHGELNPSGSRGRRGFSPFAIRCMSLSLTLAAILLAPSSALGDETPRTGIIDEAGVVDAAKKHEINRWLLELEQK